MLGLGNPGPRYQDTRHNLGAAVVETWARQKGCDPLRAGHHSLWGAARSGGRRVLVALPQTYMNLSGQAAADLCHYFEVDPSQVLVVHDDLDLELGRLKIARRGGAGGHRGVASVIQSLDSQDFLRLKLGIGRPRFAEPIEGYVLSGFYPDQHSLAEKMVHLAVDCLEAILTHGVEAAMQIFHRATTEEVEG